VKPDLTPPAGDANKAPGDDHLSNMMGFSELTGRQFQTNGSRRVRTGTWIWRVL